MWEKSDGGGQSAVAGNSEIIAGVRRGRRGRAKGDEKLWRGRGTTHPIRKACAIRGASTVKSQGRLLRSLSFSVPNHHLQFISHI